MEWAKPINHSGEPEDAKVEGHFLRKDDLAVYLGIDPANIPPGVGVIRRVPECEPSPGVSGDRKADRTILDGERVFVQIDGALISLAGVVRLANRDR